MADTPDAGGLGAISPLLGTRAAQAAVDSLAKNVTKLSDSLSKISASLSRTAQAHRGGLGNPGTLGGGKPNGGGSTPYQPGQHWNNVFLNGGGGAPPATGQQTGGKGNGGWTPGRVGVLGVSALAGAGLARMDTMVATNTTAQMMARNSNMSWGNVRSTFMRNNYTATDSLDAAQGGANLQRLGYRVGTAGFGRANNFVKNVGLIDPSLTATQASGAMAGMGSASTYNYLAARGISTMGPGGRPMDPNQLAGQLINRIGGTGKWTKGQAEYFMGDRGQGRIALDAMLRSGAIDQDQYATLSASMKAQTTFMSNGGTAEQFQNAIARGDRKTLSRYGINQTDTNNIKNLQAKQRNVEDNMAEGFSKGLEHATSALGAFADALNAATQNTGLGAALGYGQGAAGTMAVGAGGLALGLMGKYAAFKVGKAGLKWATRGGGGSSVGTAVRGVSGALGGAGGFAAKAGSLAKFARFAPGIGIGMGGLMTSADLGPEAQAEWDARMSGLQADRMSDLQAGGTGGNSRADMQGDAKSGKSGGRTVSLQRPCSGPITSKFGPRRSPGGIGSRNHKGVDFGAPNGAPIVAANSGRVVSAGMTSGGYGNQTIIDHGDGLKTMYAHQSAIRVRPGQTVRRGQNIGAVGSTGNSTGPHLHFEVHLNGRPVDPAPYLGGGGMAGSGNSSSMAALGAPANEAGSSGSSSTVSGRSGTAVGTSEADIVAAALGGSAGLASVANKGASGESTGAAAGSGTSTPASGASTIPNGSLKSILTRAGFRGKALDIAYGIAMAESSGNPRAFNGNAATGDKSYGLFQINMLGAMGPERLKRFGLRNNEQLFDPAVNARVAYQMSGRGTKWGDWSTYNNGAYKKYLGGENKRYDVGATNVDVDQIAKVHKGETILDADSAEAFRQALKGNNPTKGLFGGGGGGKVVLQFNQGSVVLHASGPMNDSQATDFAKSFVNILANNEELKKIAEGV